MWFGRKREGERMSRAYKPFYGEIVAVFTVKTLCELKISLAVNFDKGSRVVSENLSRFYVVSKKTKQ